jgi:hypothetical protein
MAQGELALDNTLLSLIVLGGGSLALAAYIAYVRLRGPRLVDCHYSTIVSESPVTAIDRVEHVVAGVPHYSYRRVGLDTLEIIRGDERPDEDAERALPEIAGAVLDLLHATARRMDTGTVVVLDGRAERSVIRAIRSALSRAQRPS